MTPPTSLVFCAALLATAAKTGAPLALAASRKIVEGMVLLLESDKET